MHYANLNCYCIVRVHTEKHALPAKCVLNVLFLVADFKPSRGIETYSEAVFHASVRDGVDVVAKLT